VHLRPLQCLSGALYRGDFARIMRSVGLMHWLIVSSRRITIDDASVLKATRGISFYSETIRAIKADGLEDAPEDYGQFVKYSGTLPGFPHAFPLGLGAVFITDQRTPVDGNSALALAASRYRDVFRITERDSHRGVFHAGFAPSLGRTFDAVDATESNGSSCCPPPRGAGAASSEAASSSCCAPSTQAAASSCCAPSSAGSTCC
jgi:arsenite methyltransferase